MNALSNYLTINLRLLQEKEFGQLIQVNFSNKSKGNDDFSLGNIECFELSTSSSPGQLITRFVKEFFWRKARAFSGTSKRVFLVLDIQRKIELILCRNWRIVIVFI